MRTQPCVARPNPPLDSGSADERTLRHLVGRAANGAADRNHRDEWKRIVSNAAESPQTESSEIVLSIDVTERYTDGYNQGAEDDGTLSAGKIVFIGIVCLLLITGIIIIAVKSRYDEDGENDR